MSEKLFIYSHTKGNIDYYNVNPKFEVTIPSINLETGNIEEKKIVGYTYHRNLEMYKIHDPQGRFNDFWVSTDHSMIIYRDDKYLKVSPLELLENKNGYLVKKLEDNDKIFIPISEIEITYDPEITDAGDFTVEDNYTFCTADGVFVQDSVAVYRPLTSRSIKECEEKLWTIKNVYSAANATIQFKPKQGIVHGVYKLTSTEKGRKLFKEVLELEKDINEPVDSKKLTEIITEECNKGRVDILDKIKTLGFSTILSAPETLSLLDLQPFNIELTGDREKDNEIINETTDIIKEKFSKKDIINSGARASWDQVRQMLAARGYVSDFFGNIVPIPVKSSYANGLDPYDFFISCYGTRKGLLDVAENTAKSGFLTRKMVYATISCELDLNTEDCGTEYCIMINVVDEDMAKALVGRYYYADEETEELSHITFDNYKQLVGKTIYLRSPLVCQGKKICKTCYGSLADIHKSKYVGIIAAQTIGERSTQLVLRTFHTSGSAQGKNLDKQEDIVSTITEISTLDKTLDINDVNEAFEYSYQLFKMFKEHGYIHLIHFEILTSQRLWAELPDKFVRYRTHIKDLEQYEEYDEHGRIVDTKYRLKLVSIKNVASLESWFLGMIFQNTRENFIKGLLYPSDKMTILEKIVLGQIG